MHVLKMHSSDLDIAIGGHCSDKAFPNRNRKSKYFTSFNDYPQKLYPGFCNGPCYTSSLALARNVTSVSPSVPFFHLEDVYLSLCVQKLEKPFSLKKLSGFLVRSKNVCWMKSLSCVSVHQVSPALLRKTWEAECPKSDFEVWPVGRAKSLLGPWREGGEGGRVGASKTGEVHKI